jgi:transposase
MGSKSKRRFSAEFKAETVRLVEQSDQSIAELSRDLDVSETSIRKWVEQARVDAGEQTGLSTDERAELSRLRRENRTLRMEREILKKATAFFARESR